MKKDRVTIGRYLGARLKEIGIDHYFSVPGDYNLALLDQLLLCPELTMVGCCNELNAGYAADGYARTRRVAATVTTFSVGALSQINAIAGAYAEDLPVIAISGGPNTNSTRAKAILHHTTGKPDYTYVRDCFARVTAFSCIIDDPKKACRQIDHALRTALAAHKPVYIEIACNLESYPCEAPATPLLHMREQWNKRTLQSAVEKAFALLSRARRSVLIVGPRVRSANAIESFDALIRAAGFPAACMPNAKGMVNEALPSFCGLYWGEMSTGGAKATVETADILLFAGPAFTDYTTVGYTLAAFSKPAIRVDEHSVTIRGKRYADIPMSVFLSSLAERFTAAGRSRTQPRLQKAARIGAPRKSVKLTLRRLYQLASTLFDDRSIVIAETGDAWFDALQLPLPPGAQFEIQMQYGSIGWSVGATLGASLGTARDQRPILFVGDGSFQMTAQEVSTMIRYGANPIIFLVNNNGYVIEIKIHDGPYNQIQNWNYAELVKVFNGNAGNGWSQTVRTEDELARAIAHARNNKAVSFIEVMIDQKDAAPSLVTFGKAAARYNSMPYRRP